MDDTQIKRVLEALLLVSEKPLLIEQAREVLGAGVEPSDIRRLLTTLAQEYTDTGRGIRVVEVAEGFQLVTDPEVASFVTKLTKRVRTVRLTKPSLETLAIIAYRQPITRAEIEQIRGVDVSGVLDTLLRVGVTRVAGRKEAVGRPLLYGTTREFLDHFGLKSIKDLPSLRQLHGEPGELPEMAGIAEAESRMATEADPAPADTADAPAAAPEAQDAPAQAPAAEVSPEAKTEGKAAP